jgi:hypothetical protein
MTLLHYLVCAIAQGLASSDAKYNINSPAFAQNVITCAENIEAALTERAAKAVVHKPTTADGEIDAALDALRVPAADWSVSRFAGRFCVTQAEAEALRHLPDVEQPIVLRWLFRVR